MPDGVRVAVLGPVVIRVGDAVVPVTRPLERGLLTRLALARGVGVPDGQLAADLWDVDDGDSRVRRLRVVVSRLRRTLGPAGDAIVRGGGGYRVVADVPDLREAGAAADRLRAAVRTGDHAGARDAAVAALRPWRGPALSDLRVLPFGRGEGERLDAWRIELSVHRLTAEIALGAGPEVVAELADLAARSPLHEPLHGMLAIALYRAGRQADALAEVAGLRRALADELGVDPTVETADLELRLLRHDPGLRPDAPVPVTPAAVTAAAPAVTDIDPALARGLVGRRTELAALAARLDAALAGERSVVVIEGAPGVGRTRMLEALDDLCAQHDVTVCWGRATAVGGVPAFWPWRQALRQWRQRTPAATASPVLAAAGAPLARIAPELVPRADATTTTALPPDPDDRFALFEHVVAFLDDAASAGTGLVLLLDDLHVADLASLLLLAHVARTESGSPLLVAATLRPAGSGDGPADVGADVRADLLRHPATTRIELAGLTASAVGEQLAHVLGGPCDPELADAIAHRTGGNPLFVREIGRAMAAGDDGLPVAVRDAVRARLDALPAAGRAVLADAAVLGDEIDADLLAAAAEESLADVLDRLDEAVTAGFLARADRWDRYRFGHDILREALLHDVGSGRRARLHLRAAEHLEATGGGAHRIAHHRLEAVPAGDREQAVRAVRVAADLALRQLAFEDAVTLYDRALDTGSMLDLAGRAELLLSRARAQHLSHDVASAMQSCEQAVALAEHLGDTALPGRAAMVLHDVGDPAWLTRVRRWCRSALAALPPGDGAVRARVTAQLAVASVWDDDGVGAGDGAATVEGIGAAALEMADRVGDPTATVTALRARQLARSGPEGTHERLRLGGRMLALVPDAGDPAELWGRLWRFDALVALGRVDEADRELDLLEPVVERMRQPLPRWHLIRSRAAVLSGRGRFPEARVAADEAVRAAQRGRHRAAEYPAHSLRLSIDLLTGDPVDPVVFEVERHQPPPRLLSLMAARCAAAHGDPEEAERIWARMPRPETVALLPFMHLVFHAVSGSLAAALGDDRAADHSYDALLPHADLHVAAGAGAGFTEGSVHLVLGTIAAARDRTATAVDHLRAAVAANTAAGLVPTATLAGARLAGALRRRGERGDAAEADAVGERATATAARLGMPLR